MTKLRNESKRIFHLDYTLVSLLVLLFILSITAIYLSGPLQYNTNPIELIIRQTIWFILGIATIVLLLRFGTERLFTLSYVLYWVMMALLLILLIDKYTPINIPIIQPVNGTWGWYQIPGLGSFQPAEFMKIALLFIASNIIYEHNLDKTESSFLNDFQLIFKIAKYALPPLVLIFLQPETGIIIIILFSLAMMFFVSGAKAQWAISIFSLAFGALFLIVWLYNNNQDLLNRLLGGSEASYRLARFYGWLDYERFAADEGYHLFSSLLSIGTAGLTGHPLGQVIMAFPEAQTDFIFTVIAQNFGLLGALIAISLSFGLSFKLLHTALSSDLPRERYLMIGVVGMLAFQQFQNMGMVTGLLPIMGITLPFISYGGSSYLSYMIPMAVAFHMYSEIQNAHLH